MICRLAPLVIAVLWASAVALMLFGSRGPGGDPLAGIALVILGMPWIALAGLLPEAARPVLGFLAPGIWVLLAWGLCRWGRSRA